MTPQEQAQATKDALVTEFFGVANKIKRADLGRAHPVPQCAALWIALLDHPDDNGLLPTTILPRQKPTGGRTQWYGVAFSLAQSRDFREQLTAFVGPTLSTYRGHAFPLDSSDAAENAIIEATGLPNAPAQFAAIDKESGRELVAALSLMANVRAGAEMRGVEQVVATGRVLRRFELALRAGRRDEAESHLAYLRRHHRLDRLNLQFLDVQLRAELGLWHEIVDMRHFNDLAQVRRPKAVTDALLRALFETFLAQSETAHNSAALAAAFEAEIAPRGGTLFEVAAGLTSPGALKTLLAWSVQRNQAATGHAVWQRLQSATPALSPDEHDFWLAVANRLAPFAPALAPAITPSAAVDLLVVAQEAIGDARSEEAWITLASASASPQRAAMLLLCAQMIGTLDARQTATQALNELETSERDELLSNVHHAKLWTQWQQEDGVASTSTTISAAAAISPSVQVPANWLQWLDLVEEPECSYPRLHAFAAQGAQEWPLADLVANPQALEELEDRLEIAASHNHDRLFAGVPALLRFLERDGAAPRPALKPLLCRLRSLLAYYGETSDLSQWSVYADLCRSTLELGVSESAYGELIEETELLWHDRLALSNVEAALDNLDILWVYPCPDIEGRASLANRVFGQVLDWIDSGRLDPELERFCRQLASDYKLDELLPPSREGVERDGDTPVDPLSFLAGQKVAIYSLMESTAQRVRDLVKRRCPDCQIEINHDTTATSALSNLARTADVFVNVTASATHAATGAIAAARGKEQATILVNSKGSSALLRALSALALQSQQDLAGDEAA